MAPPSRLSRGALKPLNEREEIFLDNFFNPEFNGDLVLSYVQAGYSDGPKAASNARAKLRELGEHIRMRSFDRLGTHIPWAINELVTLATTTKSDMVRLKCLQDILSRSGLDQPLVIDNRNGEETRQLSTKEIAGEVAKLLEKASQKPNLKVVGGTENGTT